MAKVVIDLGNSDKPNLRYITGFASLPNGDKTLRYSIYSTFALDDDSLESCKAIHPEFNIFLED